MKRKLRIMILLRFVPRDAYFWSNARACYSMDELWLNGGKVKMLRATEKSKQMFLPSIEPSWLGTNGRGLWLWNEFKRGDKLMDAEIIAVERLMRQQLVEGACFRVSNIDKLVLKTLSFSSSDEKITWDLLWTKIIPCKKQSLCNMILSWNNFEGLNI